MIYKLTRSRRKTLAIYILPDASIEVRAPLRISNMEIDGFVKSKLCWIEKKQAQIAARRPDTPRVLPQTPYARGEFEYAVFNLIKEWEERLYVKAAFVGIRKMTTRWGSATSKTRRIRLNAALAYCPRECLEYVIVHELAHLRENNHSPRFWAIVAKALPDYKARQAKLRALQWILDLG